MSLPAGDCRDACISQFTDDLDPAGFCAVTHPRARKPYRCCECGDAIQPGDEYERVVGRWEGAFSTLRSCAPCAEIRGAFCCDGWVYTALWEDAYESLFPWLTTGCLDNLTSAAAKAKLLERWRRWKGVP